jgi:hypothetical protein
VTTEASKIPGNLGFRPPSKPTSSLRHFEVAIFPPTRGAGPVISWSWLADQAKIDQVTRWRVVLLFLLQRQNQVTRWRVVLVFIATSKLGHSLARRVGQHRN